MATTGESRITKAFIPAAGRGTRLMPLTLHQPKGMVGVHDRPMIHYPLQELKDAGIRHIIIAVAPHQPQYQEYAEHLLRTDWKDSGVEFSFVVQPEPIGSADALDRAQGLLGDEPFVVHFSDNVIDQRPSMTRMLLEHHARLRTAIVPLELVPHALISQYATTGYEDMGGGLYRITEIIEKPAPGQILSYYSVMPSNVLTPDMFPYIEKARERFTEKKEIAISDMLSLYVQDRPVYGWRFDGLVFNTGLKHGLAQAQVHAAMQDPDVRPHVLEYLERHQKMRVEDAQAMPVSLE